MTEQPRKVFISYSHDSPEHDARVLALADALRAHGVDAMIDQYEPVPLDGWPRWIQENLDNADFVLMVCTETYDRRAQGKETGGKGKGVGWEGNIIYNRLYNNPSQGHKYLPVVFDAADARFIPVPLRGFTHFHLTDFSLDDEEYEALYRHITKQEATPKPELGKVKPLPSKRTVSTATTQKLPLWNVPYTRNPFFTGREDVLLEINKTLHDAKPAAITQPAAISGLGGIGKTQTAVEYAYRHRDEYQAIFWMRAESETTLRESFVDIARRLKLPEAEAIDQNLAIEAVKSWLATVDGWLLIMDNADEIAMTHGFLPTTSQGRILYTTRKSATGRFATAISVKKLSEEEGATLLLRRAKLIAGDAKLEMANDEDRLAALAIAKEVDGLPLALDQAGAFIEQASSPSRYSELFKKQAAKLLAEYGEKSDHEHASVAVTFSLAFEKAEAANPAVGDLLRLCAFLAPDDIPDFIFTEGTDEELGSRLAVITGDEFEWAKLVGEACRFSLISQDADRRTLSIHRLVQIVLHDAINECDQSMWAERAVGIICNAFPGGEFSNWGVCDQLLSHQQVCVGWIHKFNFVSYDAGVLLNQTGYYLHERGQYTLAEPLYKQSIKVKKLLIGGDQSDVVRSLNNLAALYESQGRYNEAEPLYLEAITVKRKQLGNDHLDTAISLISLASLYENYGRYMDAEPLYLEALEIHKRQLGADHIDIASCLNNLGLFYNTQGRYMEAELFYLEALEIHKRQMELDHLDMAIGLNNLASLYRVQGRYVEAESLYVDALEIHRKLLGSDHPATAQSLNNLASMYETPGRYSEAEPLHLEALEIRKRQLGADHPDTATSLNNLALVFHNQGRYSEAESLYLEAIEIRKKQLGPYHTDIAWSLSNLALLYRVHGRYSEAEPLHLEALKIRKRQLGIDHPDTAMSLNNLANLYAIQDRYSEAEPLYLEALEIKRRIFGLDHPATAPTLNNLAFLYFKQFRYDTAKLYMKLVVKIRLEMFGPEDWRTIKSQMFYNLVVQALQKQQDENQTQPN